MNDNLDSPPQVPVSDSKLALIDSLAEVGIAGGYAHIWQRDWFRIEEAARNWLTLSEKVEALRQAIEDEGPRPFFHRQTMMRHRAEWRTLWRAIDDLLEE